MPCSGEGAEGKKRRRGRPTKYRPEYAAQAYDLSKLGTIDEALADHFDVDVTTISKWKRDYPEFSQALKRGKAVADNEVAPALLSRALGAEYVERQAFKLREVKYVNGKRVRETERIEVVEVLRRLPPDVTACIFWLKNRQRESWSDRHEVQRGGKDGGPIDIRPVRERLIEELDQIAAHRAATIAPPLNGA